MHTDDRVIVSETGQESVVYSRSDGMGIEMLREANFRLLILSKEQNAVVKRRAEKLKIEVIHGVNDKVSNLSAWLEANDLNWSQIAFVGNDINDVACLRKAAFGVCPSDAAIQAKRVADIILPETGGNGALRSLAEIILGELQ